MSKTVVRVEDITKKYLLYNNKKDRFIETFHLSKKKRSKEFMALNHVSFDVQQGEFIGVIGKNGSGKSTLLKILTGVLTPTSGKLELEGRIAALLELGAGFNPEYTGIENVYLNGSIMGFSRSDMEARMPQIIEFADIGEYINQPVKMYSSGMYVRLAFAVAINVDPDILIVDEALAVGDINFQLKCMAKFDEFREKGVTIIFVSHDIHSIKKFCNRTIWLKDGMIQSQGETAVVTDAYLDYLKVEAAGELGQEIVSPVSEESIQEEDGGSSEKVQQKGADAEIQNVNKQSDVVPKKIPQCNILGVTLLNERLEEISVVEFGSKVYARLDFEMLNDAIPEISVGIAIHSVDNKYICGLNTMIDQFPVPYRIGKNSVYLEYTNFNLLGGTYYFDAAVFEKNAYVPLEYITRIAEFYAHADYVGEGILILDHVWRKHDEV
ncbi:teichoic acid ABC transporter ATP-binding protein [Christensenellaceae bacterium]|nr:teichoic acid ABC transporter ATP-binding protein [Christensenellaceae bacterium]BDF62130.1 teichoic acid ABC transporter ATP-binding protein [Christensenellaceae bacterium]